MSFKKLLRQLFSFSKTEANGVLVIFALITFCLLSPALYKSFFGSQYDLYEKDRATLDNLVSSFNSQPKIKESVDNTLKKFDPNKFNQVELQTSGLPQFLSQRIEKYVQAGGSFIIKEDLKKIYGMSDSLYEKLERYILLPDQVNDIKYEKVISTEVRKEKALAFTKTNRFKGDGLLININEGDTSSFKQLYGIGSSYANRIVNFRNALGGFHSIEQLRGMYGMTDSLFYQVRSFLTISDSVELKAIRINIATFKQLLSHPYISYELTQEILIAKSKYGKFNEPDDLSRLTRLSTDSASLLLPYLSF